MNQFKIGYAVKSGNEIKIKPAHMIVTGITGKAGKTTALESMCLRSKSKVIVFSTKIGEKSFLGANRIAPFFKEKNDWQYVESLIESTMKQNVSKTDRATIIKICSQTKGKSLMEFKAIVDSRLEKTTSKSEDIILTNIQAYLEIIVPKIQRTNFSEELILKNGINIVDLEKYDSEVQSIIVSSILNEILENHHDTIAVMPESWKFIPQKKGNPCKSVVEKYIRQGATNGNYIWIDSQDMTNIDKTILKQISDWVLGYQSEKNEVKHTIDQIPVGKENKPTEEKIMMLGKGVFYFATRDLVSKVYIQPFWLNDKDAIEIAKGNLNVEDDTVQKQFLDREENIENDDKKLSLEEEFYEYKLESERKIKRLENELEAVTYENEEMKQKLNKSEKFTAFGTVRI